MFQLERIDDEDPNQAVFKREDIRHGATTNLAVWRFYAPPNDDLVFTSIRERVGLEGSSEVKQRDYKALIYKSLTSLLMPSLLNPPIRKDCS